MLAEVCPVCRQKASFATLASEPRIYAHKCARYDGLMMYWYSGCVSLFVSLSHAQATSKRDLRQPPEWPAEVFDLVRPEMSRSELL